MLKSKLDILLGESEEDHFNTREIDTSSLLNKQEILDRNQDEKNGKNMPLEPSYFYAVYC